MNKDYILASLEAQVSLDNMERYFFKPCFSALSQTLTLYPALAPRLPCFPVLPTVLATLDWIEACNRIILEFLQGLPAMHSEMMTAEILAAACNEDRAPAVEPSLLPAPNGWIHRYREQDEYISPNVGMEVDYARDLDDAPTFPEALAALEAWKARRAT